MSPRYLTDIYTKKAIVVGLYFMCFLIVISCSNTPPKYDNVLASIDDLEVTKKHFQVAFKQYYQKTGRAIPVNNVTRKAILDNELNKFAVVKYGQKHGWDSDDEGLYRQNIIERKAFMEAYKKQHILPKVKITDGDLRWQFVHFNTKLRASHLFAHHKKEADSLYKLVKEGYSFKELAASVFNHPNLANSGGDLGYFTIDEMDPAFEQKAYELKVGEISKPVRTNQGWSIIKVTDRKKNPVITEQDYAKKKRSMFDYLKKKKIELAVREDIRQNIEQLSISYNTIQILWDDIKGQNEAFIKSFSEQKKIPIQIQNTNENIATNEELRFTARDFLVEAYYTPSEKRAELKNYADFKNFVEGLIYRSFAIQEIKNSGEADHSYINETIKASIHTYLNERFRRHLEAQYHLPSDTARSIYEENQKDYVKPVQIKLFRVISDTEEAAGKAKKALQSEQDFSQVLNHYATNDPYFPSGTTEFIEVTQFGDYAPEIGKLQAGQFFGPMEWNQKYLIYKCLDRKEARPMTFEEAYPVIKMEEKDPALEKMKDQLLGNIKEEYETHINYKELQKTPINI